MKHADILIWYARKNSLGRVCNISKLMFVATGTILHLKKNQIRWSTLDHNKRIFIQQPYDFIIFHAFLFVNLTESTNVFKLGVKETGHCAPTIRAVICSRIIHCSFPLPL